MLVLKIFSEGIPIVSLDRIYTRIDKENIFFLDCTRLEGSNDLVSRNNSYDFYSIDKQINYLSNMFLENGIDQIFLLDDVVFSGSVLRSIIEKFRQNNIEVIGIRTCISTINSYNYFNTLLPLGLKCGYLMEKDVIDQICERDFYFGIAGSGISIKNENNDIYKAPYFKPFGNPVARASIPQEYENYFSASCIYRSIELWKEIEKNSQKNFYIRDLPEKIIFTDDYDEITTSLKRRLRK